MDLIETVSAIMDQLKEQWEKSSGHLTDDQLNGMLSKAKQSIIAATLCYTTQDVSDVLKGMSEITLPIIEN